jgi:very-short-patch-repair endonuclease
VHFGVGRVVEMHVTPAGAEAALVARARRQHGVLTTRQLLDAGFGRNAIAGRVARGWLRRAHYGVYVVGALESELTAPTAALAAYGRNAVISHRTAAVLWRLLPARPDDPVDITLLNANRRSRPGVRIHRAKQSVVRRRHGLRLTSPAQTLADLDEPELERAYNEALVLNLVTHQEVRALVHRSPALRAILEEAPGMTRSKMERALRALIKQAGLPTPQSNVVVHGYEVDMYWPEARLVVEFDGWNTHSSRTAFESDRLKDAALQLAGERVLRVTGRQLARRREQLLARLATAISAIRPDHAPLVN